MDDQTPPPRRRRIAGESAGPSKSKAAKPVAKKPVAKKPAGKKNEPTPAQGKTSKVGQAVARQSAATDAESPVESTPESKQAKTTGSAPTRNRATIATVVAIVSVAVGAGLLAWGIVDRTSGGFEDAREEARSTAADSAETILSYAYDDLEAHHEEAKSVMTNEYAAEYDESTAPSLDELAPQRKVTVEAVVRNAGLVPCGANCSADEASVLLFVDLDRRVEDGETVEVFGNRLVVDMVRDNDGTWLVSDVQGI